MKKITHSVYQKIVAEKLAKWLKRKNRRLEWKQLRAALQLLRINLDPVRPGLERLYADSPRGRPPIDPVLMLRACLLMLILRYESIAKFATALRRSPRLAILAGFDPFQTPGIGTFYLFIDRLEDGPFTPACPHRVTPSEQRHGLHQRNLNQEKADKQAQRKQILDQADSLTQHLADQLLKNSHQPRPDDFLKRLEDLLLKAAVLPSAQRGLLGDLQHVILAGDGSALPTAASASGKPTCDCRAQGRFRCDCPRLYADPTADWGYDSYHECSYFGHTYYQHVVSTQGHDLPVHITIGPASESDFTLSLKSLDRFLKTCAEHHLDIAIDAVAYDAGHDGRGIYHYLGAKRIRPVIALNPRSGQHPRPTGTAQAVSDDGVPLCPAGLLMRRHGRAGHRIIYHCPVKRPTHHDGQHTWNVFPDQCPLKVLCQPDTKMGPVVYVRSDHDPRLYPEIARHSPRYHQIMNRRSGCERSNSMKKTTHRLGRRPCRSATHFLFRLYLVSIIEHAKAWLAEDINRLGKDWLRLADPVQIHALAQAA